MGGGRFNGLHPFLNPPLSHPHPNITCLTLRPLLCPISQLTNWCATGSLLSASFCSGFCSGSVLVLRPDALAAWLALLPPQNRGQTLLIILAFCFCLSFIPAECRWLYMQMFLKVKLFGINTVYKHLSVILAFSLLQDLPFTIQPKGRQVTPSQLYSPSPHWVAFYKVFIPLEPLHIIHVKTKRLSVLQGILMGQKHKAADV